MAKEICISTTPHETRLAIIEDEQLTEIYYERENEYTLAGSIYKGKVTRVLPGMQSAFVDLGLERDAFLYVTDFLEEQEDSEEFAEVKPQQQSGRGGRRGGAGREQERGSDRTSDRAADRTPDRSAGRQEAVGSASAEARGEQDEASSGSGGEPGAAGQEEFEEGTRRWRGRRGRRRGVRGARGQEGRAEDAGAEEPGSGNQHPNGGLQIEAQAETDTIERAESQPGSGSEERSRAPRRSRGSSGPSSAGSITLPGEALQKYGQQPAAAEPAGEPAPAASRPRQARSTSRPSTLVESPISWDGVSHALPGESLSRHRERPAAPAPAEPAFAQPTTEEATFTPAAEDLHATSSETASIDTVFPPAHAEEESQPETGQAHTPLVLEEREEPGTETSFAIETEEREFEPEQDASASHRVDPSSPSEFRLSSLFGREPERPEHEHPEHEQPEPHSTAVETAEGSAPAGFHGQQEHPEPEPHEAEPGAGEHEAAHDDAAAEAVAHHADTEHAATLEHLHAFIPGDGQVEEEVIDEEEYDFAPLPEHAHDDEHDLSDLVEEETQVAGGAEIGDVIRDAQIDRQVTTSDDDDFDDSDEEEEEGEAGEEQPAPAVAGGEPSAAPRRAGRDRQRGRERRGRGRNGRRQSAQTSDLPIISELLKQGQEILVQIAKEPIAKKGARITSHIALPGRFLVFMPTVNHVGVSRKIWSDEERQRLKRILISEKGDASGGFIVRTAAENASEEELRADLRFLISLWTEIKQRSDSAKAPALIYHDLNLVERVLRDQVSDNFSTIWVDSEAEYERIVRFLNRFQPSLVRRVKLYTKETPLFEQFGIQEEITKALKSKVWLKSGGSIVINQTEALVAIDINTGKYVGKTARLEDTILKTNLDAIPEIVRQIRLRDLGGIIVIDFIDMDERKNRHKVMQALEEELKNDRAPSKVLQFNDFGLVAITRKRVKQSLERTLSVQCTICAGTGMVKGPTTVANEIYTEMRKMQKHFERHDVMLRVHPEVVKTLKGNNARWLNELEEITGRTIIVKSDPALHPEQFDIH